MASYPWGRLPAQLADNRIERCGCLVVSMWIVMVMRYLKQSPYTYTVKIEVPYGHLSVRICWASATLQMFQEHHGATVALQRSCCDTIGANSTLITITRHQVFVLWVLYYPPMVLWVSNWHSQVYGGCWGCYTGQVVKSIWDTNICSHINRAPQNNKLNPYLTRNSAWMIQSIWMVVKEITMPNEVLSGVCR